MAATDVNDKIIKQKLEHKVITEYTEACRAGALSIAEGLIAPLGGMPSIPVERTESSGESKDVSESQSSDAVDDSSSQIFVFNGIFFSKAIDSKDVYKVAFVIM